MFGKGSFSLPAIYLGCSFSVGGFILLLLMCIATDFKREPDVGYAHCLLNIDNNVGKCTTREK